MTVYIYDGSFEGLLSCVFESYRLKKIPVAIVDEQQQFMFLDETVQIKTNEEYSTRVLKRIDKLTQQQASTLVYKVFLSELPRAEILIYHVIDTIIRAQSPAILENFANAYILEAAQIAKMIHREVHRMHAFVRFQKSREGLFYAAINPDFNVLPLIGDHFERRYADQAWLIFDTKRHYGLHYDLAETRFTTVDNPVFNLTTGALQADIIDEKEKTYQILWENYFRSVNIKERNNPKLHLRHLPKRYWKYLIEKQRH